MDLSVCSPFFSLALHLLDFSLETWAINFEFEVDGIPSRAVRIGVEACELLVQVGASALPSSSGTCRTDVGISGGFSIGPVGPLCKSKVL